MNDVYLSLGSNIGNRELFLHDAIEALGNDANILIDKTAGFYETSPVGNVEQRPFVNTAVKIATTYTPQQLIRFIHEIEQGLHRTRTIHWGPRTIDIDIVFFGDQQIDTKQLTVPHPEAFNRLFVLVPILEIIDKEFPSYQKIESTISALKDKDQTIQKMTSNENYKGTLQASVRQLLTTVGENPDRPGLVETPDRVARMYGEIFSSIGIEDFDDYKLFDAPVSQSSKMVMVKDIPFYSMCEHHMMPFWGKVSVGYIPDHGKIIGLSKIPRLVDFVSHKLSLQEKVTNDIITQMNKILQPKGVAVLIDARHMCVEMRGVKKTGSVTQTTSFSGIFQTDEQLQSEFMSSI